MVSRTCQICPEISGDDQAQGAPEVRKEWWCFGEHASAQAISPERFEGGQEGVVRIS